MKSLFCYLYLLLAVLYLRVSATQVSFKSGLLSRSNVTDVLDTDDDSDLEEWLEANARTPSSMLSACPISCRSSSNSTAEPGWPLFSDISDLTSCNETMLLDLVVQNDVPNGQKVNPMGIRACTADYGSEMKGAKKPDDEKAALCSTPNHVMMSASLRISHPTISDDDDVGFAVQDFLSAGHQVVNYLTAQKLPCAKNALVFGYSQSSILGLFAGAELHQQGLTIEILNDLLTHVMENSLSKTTVVQLCQAEHRGADYAIGIIASHATNLSFVRKAVDTWVKGKCVPEANSNDDWKIITLRVPPLVMSNTTIENNMTANGTSTTLRPRSRIVARSECKTTTVQGGEGCSAVATRCKINQDDLKKYNSRSDFCNTLVAGEKVCCSAGTLPDTIPPGNSDGTCKTQGVIGGDSCGSLASKCGLIPADFAKVNTKNNLCSTLAAGQRVCCTRGRLPDFRPKPNSDGSCSTYTTQQDDSCSVIAASRDLNVTDIENFNKNTWGWSGCKLLYVGFKLCVSSGTPPMPAPVAVSQFPYQTDLH